MANAHQIVVMCAIKENNLFPMTEDELARATGLTTEEAKAAAETCRRKGLFKLYMRGRGGYALSDDGKQVLSAL